MGGAWGLIWWSSRVATVGLVVEDARVVDCPPYASKWALGRDARDLWRDGARKKVRLKWLPDPDVEVPDLAAGTLWWPTDPEDVAYVVADSLVVAVHPRYAEKKTVGRTAETMWRRGHLVGVELRWQPGVEPFIPIHTATTALRCWRHPGDLAALTFTLTLGTVADGRWYLYTTGGAGIGWLYPDRDAVVAEVRRRFALDDRYRPAPSGYDNMHRPLPDPDVSGLDEALGAAGRIVPTLP